MVISGLQALEFTDCLLDSPEFRENLYRHEKELEKTNQQIKRIVKEVKDLLTAAKSEYLFLFSEIRWKFDELDPLFIPSGPPF